MAALGASSQVHVLDLPGGIRLAGGPWYVVRKDMARNAVWVSADYHGDLKDDDSDIGGLGLGSINDTGSRMAIPVQLIFGWKF